MKNGSTVKADTFIVAREDQMTGCGILYIRKGSILKVAKDKLEWASSIAVFRNKEAEQEDYTHRIAACDAREATDEEVEMWNKEIYFVELNTVNNV